MNKEIEHKDITESFQATGIPHEGVIMQALPTEAGINGWKDIPTPVRGKNGRIKWKLPENTPEENEQLGIRNVQGLFLQRFPGFIELFPMDEDGKIVEEKREEAKRFIYERIGDSRRFAQILQQSALFKSVVPYFEGSCAVAVDKSFRPWGIIFEVVEKIKNKVILNPDYQEQEALHKRETTKKIEENVLESVKTGVSLDDESFQSRDSATNNRDQNSPHILITFDNTTESVVFFLNQRRGRDALAKLAKGEVSPSETPPIYITDLRKRKYNPSGSLYIRGDIPDITLNSDVMQAYDSNGAVIFIPKEDTRFNYKWIDIYGVSEGNRVNLSNKVGSLRINTEQRRIESHGWYGPEQQAFLDCISGKLAVDDFNKLPSFVVKTPQGTDIYFGKIGRKPITSTFHEETHAEQLTIVPRHNQQLDYFWIDGYETNVSLKRPLITRRILIGESPENIKIADWKGPQIQSIIDWAYGKLPTSMLEEAEVLVDQDIKHSNIYLEVPNLTVYLNGNNKFDRTQPIYLVAREKGPYKWLEVQQDDQNSGCRRTISLLYVNQSSSKPSFNGKWPGPERQALLDYIDGIGISEDLEGIVAKLDSNRIAFITKYKGKDLKLALRSTAFNAGEEVVLMPVIDSEGNLTLMVAKIIDPEKVLARSVFIKETNSFKTTSLEASLSQLRKPLGYWTEEEIRNRARELVEISGDLSSKLIIPKQDGSFASAVSRNYPGGWVQLRRDIGIFQADKTGTYIDPKGNVWAPLSIIAKEANVSINTAIRRLTHSSLLTKEGRGYNSKKYQFYNLEEAVAFLRNSSSNDELPPIPSEEANEQMMKLLEG